MAKVTLPFQVMRSSQLPPADPRIGALDAKGIPATLEGYKRLNTLLAATDKNLPNIKFGVEGGKTIQVRSPSEAAELAIRYKYDEATDAVTDQSNGDVYNNVLGTFTTKDGKTISPGFREVVGIKNFRDFVIKPGVARPSAEDRGLELHLPDCISAFHIFPGPCHCHHVQ